LHLSVLLAFWAYWQGLFILLPTFYTEIITNNAAAALLVPIALSAAQQAGVDPRSFFYRSGNRGVSQFCYPHWLSNQLDGIRARGVPF